MPLGLLKHNGSLIIGWHTDFSGEFKNGWSHLSFAWMREMRETCRASGVLVPQMRFFWLSALVLYLCRLVRHSVAIYFHVQGVKWHDIPLK
jgi:hypothetical protein